MTQIAEEVSQVEPPASPAKQLVSHLYGQTNASTQGRRALMAMRSSLGHRDGIAESAVMHVSKFVGPPTAKSGVKRRQQLARERNFYLLAGLFSLWHVKQSSNEHSNKSIGGLGVSMKALAKQDPGAAEALMDDLTIFPQGQVSGVLIRAITLLAQRRLPVNWSSLAVDLTTTGAGNWRATQRRWASDFYSSTPKKN